MSHSRLPVENATVPFWRSSPHPLDDHRSTVELPNQVDITVIGAGFAGVATVYHILNHCTSKGVKPPSIVILEARQACSGATGRNGGHIKPDPYTRPSKALRTHGVEAAGELAEFEAKNLFVVKDLVEKEKIDCDFVLTRAFDVFMNDDYRDVKSDVDLLREHGVSAMRDVHFAEGLQAEQLSGIKGAAGCFSYTAGHIFPYKLITYLLSKVIDAGVNLQTQTPVTAVSADPDEQGLLTVTTSRGAIRTTKVIFATNGHTSAVLPQFADKIVPVRGICSHIKPGKTANPLQANSYIIRWSNAKYEYLVPRLDGSVVVGGARSEYYHDLQSWYDNVDDDKLIELAQTRFDGYMQEVFRGWENSDASTSKVWTGIMGYTSDGFPHVGAVPGQENQFIVAGFNGHGMPQIFLTAKGVASMIMEQQKFENTGIPKPYQVTQERLDKPENKILESWGETFGR